MDIREVSACRDVASDMVASGFTVYPFAASPTSFEWLSWLHQTSDDTNVKTGK